MQLIVLGRQPAVSLAELESLFGADSVQPVTLDTATLDATADIDRLGGTIKVAEVLASVGSTQHHLLAKELAGLIPRTEAKFNLGLSWHDGSAKDAKALALEIKKLLKGWGQKVRVVMPTGSAVLTSAQVWHNRLDKSPNIELILAGRGRPITVARTTQVQNMEAYSRRDQGRPARDARVGMLPPKLAQIMINLAVGQIGSSKSGVRSSPLKTPTPSSQLLSPRILDPFCGTGVILQEALLMGYPAYGTDIEDRMIKMTEKNLQWLKHGERQTAGDWRLEVADATSHTWRGPIEVVVSETYLGPPLSSAPTPAKLEELARDCGQLMKEFLKNIAPQLKSATPLVLAVPAWFSGRGISHSTVVDQIEDLGYTRRGFKTLKNHELIYRRPGQVVGRELLVLTRK